MGSTGKAGSVALPTTPQAVTPTGLQEGDSQDVIQKYYSDNYGITVGGSYFKANLNTKVLVRASQVLDKLAQELGADTLKALGVKITSYDQIDKNAYAQTNILNHMIGVNPKMFNSYDGLKAQMHVDVLHGLHPKGAQAADVLIHEIGHNIDYLINAKQNNNDMTQMLISYNNQAVSKAIVQAAYAELKSEQPNLYKTEKQARASISSYADSKVTRLVNGKPSRVTAYSECLAEAVADYGRNGQNANPMSIKIWQGIKEMLK